MLKNPRYVIAVPDLAKTASYFQNVLGFRVHDLGDPGWRLFERDHCLIMAGECPDALPVAQIGDHSYFAYISVDEIDAFYSELGANGAEFVKPIRDEPWGMREFGVQTIDGHRMMFGMSYPKSKAD